MIWRGKNFNFDFADDRALVMGVLNVTPDSFSDGGKFAEPMAAETRAFEMAAQGADLIDIGGESTRPGATPVSAEEELRRVLPVIERLVALKFPLPISIDTYKARVAREVLSAGAAIVNDISAGNDPEMFGVVRDADAGLILMHMLGTPQTMQKNPQYGEVVGEIVEVLSARLQAARDAGIAGERLAVDPGLGFGKTVEHNLEIIARLGELRGLGCPILSGPSRKSFVRKTVGETPVAVLGGTMAAVATSVLNGARIVRVHDVEVIVPMTKLLAQFRKREG